MKDMKKLFYWVGLPALFVMLVASTFLIDKTYESTFVIARETERVRDGYRAMTMHQPESYDLGILRTENAMNENSYGKILQSDPVLQALINTQVRTLDGEFEGSYADYCIKDCKKKTTKKVMKIVDDSLVRWKSIEQEAIKKKMAKSIKATVDYETRYVTVKCTANDPLVATMIAEAVKVELLYYIESYQQDKMHMALEQLSASTAQAKKEWEAEPSKEKEAIWKSFERQEVIYKAQMQYVPAFAVLAEPSFSYTKVAPSRWKMPLIITLLIGIGIWGWDNRKKLMKYV